jgi:SAM-dependent methyltransferase
MLVFRHGGAMTISYPGAFSPLGWPLDRFELDDRLRDRLFPFTSAIRKTRYPIASLRYWWLGTAIAKERQLRSGELQVVDAGCHDGIFRGYAGPIDGTRWIGLDRNLDHTQGDLVDYDTLIRCDFESVLPLEDESADVVVCSHVLEHLQHPQLLIAETTRILKGNGIALIAVPTLPKPLARVAEWKWAREFSRETREKGAHINAFWPSRLVALARSSGLELEIASGIYFVRIDGCPLENLPIWIRVNQCWAGLFPSLAGEFCAQLRKPARDETRKPDRRAPSGGPG